MGTLLQFECRKNRIKFYIERQLILYDRGWVVALFLFPYRAKRLPKESAMNACIREQVIEGRHLADTPHRGNTKCFRDGSVRSKMKSKSQEDEAMMDFMEFKEQLGQDLRHDLQDQARVTESQVEKLQGQSYTAFAVTPTDGKMGMNLNVDQMFDRMQNGADYQTLLSQAVEQSKNFILHAPQFDVQNLTDYDQAKTHLFVEVVGAERNAALLDRVPHMQIEDMAMVYRVQIGGVGDGMASTLITNDLMNHMGVTKEQLHQDALRNAQEILPARMQKLSEVIAEMTGMPPEELDGAVPPLYVLSNEEKIKGAAALFYPDMMEQCTKEMGGDYFVLPSSVHEVLLLADTGEMKAEELKAMVSSINGEVVDPKDVLTDQVYHYDAKNRIFELGEAFAARQAEKEQKAEGRSSVLKDLKAKQQDAPAIPKSKDVRVKSGPEL